MIQESKGPSSLKIILVGLIGNVMELYDFAIYGFFAATIGRLFFPSEDPVTSIIASFGAFAAGFLVRPLGGIVFGRIGDLIGRQRAMFLSVIVMAVPTVGMGLLPTYAEIGIMAPILLILLRIAQGLSIGGEFTSSLVFLVENAPPARRAFYAVWGSWGATFGTLLGSGVGYLFTEILTSEELYSWGWRLPFIFGGFIGFVGYWLRHGMHEHKPTTVSKAPEKDIFTKHRWNVIRVVLLNIGFSVAFYTIFVYAVSFLHIISMFSEAKALRNNSIAMMMVLGIMPFAAMMADLYGRKKILLIGFSLLVLTAIPLFKLMGLGLPIATLACELALAFPVGLISGSIAALNVEVMHRDVRCTGLAFSYNLSVGLFGGITPMLVSWLTAFLGSSSAPGYWVAATSVVSFLTILIAIPETYRKNLATD